MEELSKALSSLCIQAKYKLDAEADTRDVAHVTSISLNFHQLWYLFGQEPCVYPNGKSGRMSNVKYYEWKVASDDAAVFTVYSWDQGGGLINTKQWHVGADTKDAALVQGFMEHLLDKMSVYSQHYKCIETGMFSHADPGHDSRMKAMEQALLSRGDALTTL